MASKASPVSRRRFLGAASTGGLADTGRRRVYDPENRQIRAE